MQGASAPALNEFWYSSGPGSGWTRLILMGPAFIISPGLLQKAYGAASPRAIRLGLGWQAAAMALFAFVPVLLGMMARASNPNITHPNLVLPTLLAEQLPPWLGALGLAAIFSAEVSTCDAILFMLATSLSKDLYNRFVRPEATDRQVLNVARWAAVAGGVGGVVLALLLQTVQQALDIFYALLTVSLMVPIVGGLYVRRAIHRARVQRDHRRGHDVDRVSDGLCRDVPLARSHLVGSCRCHCGIRADVGVGARAISHFESVVLSP